MLATGAYLIVFRIVHILGAIAWGGSLFVLVFFLQPSAKSVGPAAAPFMRELLGRRKVATVVLWIAGATLAGGAFLYWHDWQATGSLGDFLGTRFGLALTIGSVAAIAAFLVGQFGTLPAIARMLELGARMAQAGGAPPPELAGELQAVQARGRAFAKAAFGLVVVAALAMSTARYW